MQKSRLPIINTALLREYDLDTFNYEKSYKIVIERVLQPEKTLSSGGIW